MSNARLCQLVRPTKSLCSSAKHVQLFFSIAGASIAALHSDLSATVTGTLDERAAIMLLLLIERCVAAAEQCTMHDGSSRPSSAASCPFCCCDCCSG